jgi:hypothetical protein
MRNISFRGVVSGAMGLVLAATLAGCSASSPTPILIYLTPSPAPSVPATPTPEPTPTASPSPEASASASPTASPAPSSTPAAPTAGSACTGTPDVQVYFGDAAGDLSFDVYCAVLPSNWWLQDTSYTVPNGGQLTASYKNTSGGLITVGEGNFCAGAPDCWASTSDLGSASFGDLSGSLKIRAAGPVYAVYVDAGTTHGYQITGTGVSQSDFVAYAAAMMRVPRG